MQEKMFCDEFLAVLLITYEDMEKLQEQKSREGYPRPKNENITAADLAAEKSRLKDFIFCVCIFYIVLLRTSLQNHLTKKKT